MSNIIKDFVSYYQGIMDKQFFRVVRKNYSECFSDKSFIKR